ncbi:Enhancer of polycomb-like, N-terminal [Cynara cardunculus var. scolymus]|uniref:Enhancer of polycomb-like protein n=1 Tax=Cynara cardunculus var. scolymus TaxID=59895 RepID=A0A103XSN0_CYNCS|nr:Enhancer of polycomb-like, N-terminal [Cynara cardunculus var. scolymus]
MSRLSFRPRPLDYNKKLPIVKSIKDFEDDETPTSTRTQMLRLVAEADNETQVHQVASKKTVSEIPTPEYVIVDTYERDYSPTFNQPASYLRARGARAEIGDFVEYDLDNEDEDWLEEFNKERTILPAEKFETILFKLEVLDHKARERAGVITSTLGSPIPVLLTFDAASEALQALSIQYGVFQSIYGYWKEKRERWLKPVLRRLQPPPPVNDTNPYNVFRPREKAHRLHTRRVRRNLDQAKNLLEALIKYLLDEKSLIQREEKKRDVMDSEVSLQRIQMKYKNETELLEDSLALPEMPSFQSKFVSSEDEILDTDDFPHNRLRFQPHGLIDSRLVLPSGGGMKREIRRRPVPFTWLHKLDPLEPVFLFTKPLVPEKLAAARIVPPVGSRGHNFRGRIGRGGRIVFDRWNPLMHTPIECSEYMPPKPRSATHN